MRTSSTALISLAALLSPASAFVGTHPFLGFSNGACSKQHERLHLSIPGLHADDVPSMQPRAQSEDDLGQLQKAFANSEQRVYQPYLQPSERLEQHLNKILCQGQEEFESLVKMIQLDDLSGLVGQERVERLQSLGQFLRPLCSRTSCSTRRVCQKAGRLMHLVNFLAGAEISSRLRELPSAHLVTISSHPDARNLQQHSKRQMVAPDATEIEDALARLLGEEEQQNTKKEDLDKEEKEESQDWDLDDWLATASAQASGATEAAVPSRPAVVYAETSASASSSVSAAPTASASASASARPTYTSKPLASNAALVEKYAITSPNLTFAIGLFLLVLLPVGFYAISALSSMCVGPCSLDPPPSNPSLIYFSFCPTARRLSVWKARCPEVSCPQTRRISDTRFL